MAPHVDRLLALLPFEPAAFERLKGPPTLYVGHPLLDSAPAYGPTRMSSACATMPWHL
jgi:lipid-A-disaccharide synthase